MGAGLVEGSGSFVSGAWFDLYTASGGSYGLLLDTFCNAPARRPGPTN